MPENLAGMIRLIADGTISSKIAKKVFRELITNGGEAQEVVEKNGWVQLSCDQFTEDFFGDF